MIPMTLAEVAQAAGAVLGADGFGLAFDRDHWIKVPQLGGVRIGEPAADLAVMLAITSSLRGKPLPKGFLAFGEVGLAGEVRPAPRGQERLKEAAKLGFSSAFAPPQKKNGGSAGVKVKQIGHIADLAAAIGVEAQ